MDDARAAQIERLLQESGQVFRCLHSGQSQAWLSVDLTMPQLKALVHVVQGAHTTSSQVARALGVTLPTVTGIVDRLCEQGLVVRQEDPEDRRITRVVATPQAQELVRRLLRYRDERLTSLLASLDRDQLATVARAFEYLAEAAVRMDQEPEEAVA